MRSQGAAAALPGDAVREAEVPGALRSPRPPRSLSRRGRGASLRTPAAPQAAARPAPPTCPASREASPRGLAQMGCDRRWGPGTPPQPLRWVAPTVREQPWLVLKGSERARPDHPTHPRQTQPPGAHPP
ncbi:PREDICTED: neuronal pentraxin receptor-like [Lipotes vexillifer]|uniref:Neuronal pentraxin receptor-like n=1 Tax=Lipotes vexillifer TaxID=118797 RepID=A0A340XJ58_LIPVE|nr:PREDICTED: neuronal pentraxin receptor-like [Lipotes vexillifer]